MFTSLASGDRGKNAKEKFLKFIQFSLSPFAVACLIVAMVYGQIIWKKKLFFLALIMFSYM